MAIVGPPNAGKSTLANALLGRPVSITSQPGRHDPPTGSTTRAIFAAPNAGGGPDVQVPVILIDTAGIRETPDPLEQASIARTHRQAAAADVVIYLIDGTSNASGTKRLWHRSPIAQWCSAATNATLPAAQIPSALAAHHPLLISAKSHLGLEVIDDRCDRTTRPGRGGGRTLRLHR